VMMMIKNILDQVARDVVSKATKKIKMTQSALDKK
jgi:hypothetical protein